MHFTLLVTIPADKAANAVEALSLLDETLDPYYENLDVDPYFVEVDLDHLRAAIQHFTDNPMAISDGGPGLLSDIPQGHAEALQDWKARVAGAWFGYGAESGEVRDGKIGYWSTYNSDGQWDWWQLGGRWHGYFTVKPGVAVAAADNPFASLPVISKDRVDALKSLPAATPAHQALLGPGGTSNDDPTENFEARADLLRKGDIDLDSMRTFARHAADRTYDEYEKLTANLDPGPSLKERQRAALVDAGLDPNVDPYDLNHITANPGAKEAFNAAAAAHRANPWVQALQPITGIFFGDLHAAFLGGREKFVQRAENSCVTPHAILHDGKWTEDDYLRGSAGWPQQSAEFLESLPDDTWVALVDYHS